MLNVKCVSINLYINIFIKQLKPHIKFKGFLIKKSNYCHNGFQVIFCIKIVFCALETINVCTVCIPEKSHRFN